MGPDQLAGVMEQIQSKKNGNGEEAVTDKIREQTLKFKEQVTKDAESYSTSGMLIDDGIIDPRDTREVLGICLEVVSGTQDQSLQGFRALARI